MRINPRECDLLRSLSPLTEPPSPTRSTPTMPSSCQSSTALNDESPFPSPLHKRRKKRARSKDPTEHIARRKRVKSIPGINEPMARTCLPSTKTFIDAMYDTVWEPCTAYDRAASHRQASGYSGAARTLDEFITCTGSRSERLQSLIREGYRISRYRP
jgi:hypothetical protein